MSQTPRRFSLELIDENRGGGIRTHDLLLPKQALYQAKLRPGARPDGRSLEGNACRGGSTDRYYAPA